LRVRFELAHELALHQRGIVFADLLPPGAQPDDVAVLDGAHDATGQILVAR